MTLLHRLAHRLLGWAVRRDAYGNAVVPACASAAFRLLHARALNQ